MPGSCGSWELGIRPVGTHCRPGGCHRCCPVSYGKQIMDKLGIRHVHVATTDFGIERSKTLITADVIDSVTEKVKTVIREELNHGE